MVNPVQSQQKSILLLHGLGVYGESWGYQVQALESKGYRVLAPDLPGFGKSPPAEKTWSVDSAALAMVRLLDEQTIDQTVVCGLSMGGTVALRIALMHPERVNGLVLISTFAALRPRTLSEVIYFFRRGVRSYLTDPGQQARLVAERIFPNRDQSEWRELLVKSIQASDPRIYKQSMLALARFNVTRQLSSLHLPVMVITGGSDTTIPPAVQARMAESIPGAQHYLIDQAGHGVIVDHHAEVNQLLLEFLAKIYSS
jgi:pimeloyl-ACP methyl ester carboxylesterase